MTLFIINTIISLINKKIIKLNIEYTDIFNIIMIF